MHSAVEKKPQDGYVVCEECIDKAKSKAPKRATLRWSYPEAKRHADAICKMKRAKWSKVVKAAGLDPSYGPHPHNAMIGYKTGKPWPNVDYSLVRKALWIDRHMFDAQRILDRYCRKRDKENQFWIQPNQGKFA